MNEQQYIKFMSKVNRQLNIKTKDFLRSYDVEILGC